MEKTYFLGSDGKVYTSEDMEKAAFLIYGTVKENLELLKEEMTFNGIVRKLDESNIEDLVIMGRDVIATKRYYELNPGTPLKDAVDYINSLKRKYDHT